MSRCAEVSAFLRACRFVMSADFGAVEEGYRELHAPLLDQRQQALPNAKARPADESLRRLPPWPKFVRHGAPFGAIGVSPWDRADRVPQMPQRHLGGAGRFRPRVQATSIARLSAYKLLLQKKDNTTNLMRSDANGP